MVLRATVTPHLFPQAHQFSQLQVWARAQLELMDNIKVFLSSCWDSFPHCNVTCLFPSIQWKKLEVQREGPLVTQKLFYKIYAWCSLFPWQLLPTTHQIHLNLQPVLQCLGQLEEAGGGYEIHLHLDTYADGHTPSLGSEDVANQPLRHMPKAGCSGLSTQAASSVAPILADGPQLLPCPTGVRTKSGE